MKFWNKKTLGGLVLLALCLIAVLILIKTKYNMKETLAVLQRADWRIVAVALLVMPVYVLLEGLNIGNSLKIAGICPPIRHLVKYAAAGFFFSQITPSASGGQPAQLVYMKKDGIKLSHGTFALILELLSMQTAAILLGVAGMLYALFCTKTIHFDSPVMSFFLAGLTINMAAFIFLILVMFTDKPCRAIAGFALWIVQTAPAKKILDKNGTSPVSAKFTILRSIAEYRHVSGLALKDEGTMLKMLGCSLLRLILYHGIVFLAYTALGGDTRKILDLIGIQALLFISVSALPLPGAAGVTEFGFDYLFRDVISPRLMGGTILLSRGLNYLWPLILCGLILLFHALWKMAAPVKHSGCAETS